MALPTQNTNKIVAIVPAYNEAATIHRVLTVLRQTPLLDEIIVVDDGSTDDTAKVVQNFASVTLLRNVGNKGKGYSMQKGVAATNAGIIFFCDADLKQLTPEIVQSIIEPVQQGEYAMYIGVRNNMLQKAVTLFALNSGERALRREVWESLPERFKYRYRIEAGLNFIATKKHGGYGWKKFEYYQTLKEKKYGFVQGTFLRWWMNFDVMYAFALSMLTGYRTK